MKSHDLDPLEINYVLGMKRLIAIAKRNNKDTPNENNQGLRGEELGEEPKHVCLVCGYMWDTTSNKRHGPKKCPACFSIRWNSTDLHRHTCKQCSHRWMSKMENPTLCPNCRSKMWNKDIERFICESCGNIWLHKLKKWPPKGCPQCESTKIESEAVEYLCKRCGYGRKVDREMISICPMCKTALSAYDSPMKHIKDVGIDYSKSNKMSKEEIDEKALGILNSTMDDTRKMVELTNKCEITFIDAEILVRHKKGEDPVSIARVTDVSLNKVIKTTTQLLTSTAEIGSGP